MTEPAFFLASETVSYNKIWFYYHLERVVTYKDFYYDQKRKCTLLFRIFFSFFFKKEWSGSEMNKIRFVAWFWFLVPLNEDENQWIHFNKTCSACFYFCHHKQCRSITRAFTTTLNENYDLNGDWKLNQRLKILYHLSHWNVWYGSLIK